MKNFLLLVFVGVTFLSIGQLNGKLKKMVGSWEYRSGSGIEVWKEENSGLYGYEYRISKTGDTVIVEEMVIRSINKNLTYSIKEHHHNTSSNKFHKSMSFIADKRKMRFYNIDENTPYFIQYSIGLLTKNKLKVKIKSGQNDKPVKLILLRIKDAPEQF